MAESDPAGPPVSGPAPSFPKAPRSLTLADIQRDLARQAEPLERAKREVERSMAPVLAAARVVESHHRQITAMVDRAIGPYLRTFAGTPAQTKAAAPSQDSAGGIPSPAPAPPVSAFDGNPAAMSALVDTVAGEVLKTVTESFIGDPAAFKEEIRAAVADEVRKALAEAVAPKKDRKPRGETTCERLRDLHVNIDPDFAETAPEPKLGKRIERSPGSFPYSHYWVTVLRPKRQKVRAEILEAKRKAREAQRWGHFDSVGRHDDDVQANESH